MSRTSYFKKKKSSISCKELKSTVVEMKTVLEHGTIFSYNVDTLEKPTFKELRTDEIQGKVFYCLEGYNKAGDRIEFVFTKNI